MQLRHVKVQTMLHLKHAKLRRMLQPCHVKMVGIYFVLPTYLENMDVVKPLVTRIHRKEGVQKLLISKNYLKVRANI